jgi:hypothetical protein
MACPDIPLARQRQGEGMDIVYVALAAYLVGILSGGLLVALVHAWFRVAQLRRAPVGYRAWQPAGPMPLPRNSPTGTIWTDPYFY